MVTEETQVSLLFTSPFSHINVIYPKRPRKPETGGRGDFSKTKFPFGKFRPGKEDYLLTCSFAPGNFLGPEKPVPFS